MAPRAILDAANPASPLSAPAHETAVLLADFQNLIVQHFGPEAEAAARTARSLRSWADERGIPVVIASVDTGRAPPRRSRLHDSAGAMLRAFAEAPRLGEVHPALLPAQPGPAAGTAPAAGAGASPYHVTRRLGLVSALSSGGLDGILREHGTRSLIVGGISTSGCVLSTARDGTEKGYVVTVVADACADSAPGVHEALVEHVLPTTAHVVSLEELLGSWPGVGAGVDAV